MISFQDLNWFMDKALDLAYIAEGMGEVPIGCVIVDPFGKVLAETYNTKENNQVTTEHAEILAIQEANKKINSWRLNDCTLYVTLEPCPMCLSAILQARIKNVVFGAYDPKGGAISLGYNFAKDDRLNHKFSIIGGIHHYRASKILSNFFKKKRGQYNQLLK